jgi:osmoprotectant transport system ATP-binding protein
VIELCGLTRRYDGRPVVDGLDLRVERGELLVLLGSSGCGKTTTLKMINRLIEPSAGVVTIGGVDTRSVEPHALRRRIGYGFQQVGLFPHLDVARNVGVTPELLGWAPDRIARRVDRLLELVQLDPAEFRRRRPDELSGGQQQRVGLARALAAEPEVLLLDEPFGALDPLTRDHLQVAFQGIRRELGLTVVFVTHDMLEALLLGDRIAVMDEGRLLQVGTPHALLAEPADEVVASLMAAPRRQSQRVQEQLAATAGSERGADR